MQILKKFLDKENIEWQNNKNILEKFSEDTSLFKITPKIIIFPKNKYEISNILKFISESDKKYSITSRSAGSDMSGAAIGESIILSFTKYFNNIIYIDKEKMAGEVEPGVYYRDFEKESLKSNLILPSYPASREMCAIGGMVANNSGGEKSIIYGKTEDYVLEIEGVLSNGEIVNFKPLEETEFIDKLNSLDKNSLEYNIYKNIYDLVSNDKNKIIIDKNKPKVSKNSAGYYLWNILKEEKGGKVFDLTKLIVGSQGTLVIITKIKLRLVKTKKYTKTLLIFLKNLKDLGKVRNLIMKYSPESFESYDDKTFKVAFKFLPAFLKNIFKKNKEKKDDGKKINLFKLAISFWREILLLLTFGMPKLFLIAEFSGDNEKELEDKIIQCEKELNKNRNRNIKTRFIKTEFEREKFWTMRRESFNLLREKVKGLHTAPFIDDIVVRGEDLEKFLNELTPILDKYNLLYTIAGHVADGNLHIIPLMNFDNKEIISKNIEIIKRCSYEVYDLIKKYNGSITGEHNDGLIRTAFLEKMYDKDMLNLFKEVKNIFDENNILNPGKKVPINDNPKIEINNNFKYLKFER